MLKFFRGIRRKFLNEGSPRKYLVYAVGEILLVVIGILIALQINTWNEYGKERIKEEEILTQLKKEYESNLEQLDEKISMRNIIMQNSFQILGLIDEPDGIAIDSVINLLSQIGIVPTFDPISNDLIISGNLRLIRSSELRRLLSTWTSEVVQLQEEEQYWVKMRDDIFFPFVINQGLARNIVDEYFVKNTPGIFLPKSPSGVKMKTGDTRDKPNGVEKNNTVKMRIGHSKKGLSVQAILDNQEFEGILAMAITINEVANLQSKVLRQRIIDILDLIDENL